MEPRFLSLERSMERRKQKIQEDAIWPPSIIQPARYPGAYPGG
jgi:hypothetical protein